MTAAQSPLWTEPSLLDRYPVGTRVRSLWTDNQGEVVEHDTEGRRLLVHWERWRNEPDGFDCWHSSESGLVRLEAA